METETTEGLEEFLVVWPRVNEGASTSSMAAVGGDQENSPFFWTVNYTKMLIDFYKKYKELVGSMKIRNLKALWKLIAKEMSEVLSTDISEKNVENRWKVLERNYKKYIDNKNATGRGRKYFEFAAEMEDVYGNKRNIRPEILLGSDTVHIPSTITANTEEENKSEIPSSSQKKEVIRKKNVRGRKTVLQQMREDRLAYQEKRLKFLHQAHEEVMTVMKERNDLERDKIQILKEKKCTCQLLQ